MQRGAKKFNFFCVITFNLGKALVEEIELHAEYEHNDFCFTKKDITIFFLKEIQNNLQNIEDR